MTKISAAIITFNEQRNIKRCLDSLEGIADEIVVVDSYSTDKTPEICRTYDLKFVQHPFADFAAQKNFAIAQTSHKFILSMDADEALSEKLRSSILSWKNSGSQDALKMNRLNSYCGQWIKHSGWYPDSKFRLFDKTKARWAGEKVHEYLDIDKDAQKGKLEGDMLHYSVHSIEQHVDTINKYSSLKAEINFEKGKSSGFIKLFFGPLIKFLKIFIFKGGFRDGLSGYLIAKNSAYSDFLKHSKLRLLNSKAKE